MSSCPYCGRLVEDGCACCGWKSYELEADLLEEADEDIYYNGME